MIRLISLLPSRRLEDTGLFTVDTFNDPQDVLFNFKPSMYGMKICLWYKSQNWVISLSSI